MTNHDLTDLGERATAAESAAVRRRRTPLVTREQVIDVAYGLVVSDGPDGLSMRKLAAALHVSLPTVYTAIQSREFLVSKLQNRLFEDIAAELYAEDVARLGPGEHREAGEQRLATLTGAFLDWAQANPPLAEFLLSEQFSAEVAERLTRPDRTTPEAVSYLVGQVRELAAQGTLPGLDPVVGILFAVTQIRAVLSLMREPTMADVPQERWHVLATDTLARGLRALAG